MGYRSQVQCKTTSEGYTIMCQRDAKVKEYDHKMLSYADVDVSSAGNYLISWDWVKWYPSYESVSRFMNTLDYLDSLDIPYKFIRIGEEESDIEVKENYVDDQPEGMSDFCPSVIIYDAEEGDYTPIMRDGKDPKSASPA